MTTTDTAKSATRARTTFQVARARADGDGPAPPWTDIPDRDAAILLDTHHDAQGARAALFSGRRAYLRVGPGRFIRRTPSSELEGAVADQGELGGGVLELPPATWWNPTVNRPEEDKVAHLQAWLGSRGAEPATRKADLVRQVGEWLAAHPGAVYRDERVTKACAEALEAGAEPPWPGLEHDRWAQAQDDQAPTTEDPEGASSPPEVPGEATPTSSSTGSTS